MEVGVGRVVVDGRRSRSCGEGTGFVGQSWTKESSSSFLLLCRWTGLLTLESGLCDRQKLWTGIAGRVNIEGKAAEGILGNSPKCIHDYVIDSPRMQVAQYLG